MAFRLIISGEHACFSRPEIPDALVSYEVITPIAALGIIESIHWKPAIRWRVTAIHILEPIRLVEAPLPYPVLALQRPRWAVDFEFDMTPFAGPRDSVEVHTKMFLRKARRLPPLFGYLGRSAFPAAVSLCSSDEKRAPHLTGRILDLGWLPFQRRAEDGRTFHFFRARAVDGTIHVPAGPSNGHSLLDVEPLWAAALQMEEEYGELAAAEIVDRIRAGDRQGEKRTRRIDTLLTQLCRNHSVATCLPNQGAQVGT